MESLGTSVGPVDFTYNRELASQRAALDACHRRIRHWEKEAALQLKLIKETRRIMRVNNIPERV